jgi:hypothetical protein
VKGEATRGFHTLYFTPAHTLYLSIQFPSREKNEKPVTPNPDPDLDPVDRETSPTQPSILPLSRTSKEMSSVKLRRGALAGSDNVLYAIVDEKGTLWVASVAVRNHLMDDIPGICFSFSFLLGRGFSTPPPLFVCRSSTHLCPLYLPSTLHPLPLLPTRPHQNPLGGGVWQRSVPTSRARPPTRSSGR